MKNLAIKIIWTSLKVIWTIIYMAILCVSGFVMGGYNAVKYVWLDTED